MKKKEYRILKDRLYRAKNAIELSLASNPNLQNTYIQLSDGHKLFAGEVLSWIDAVRSDCWKYGPPEVQRRYINQIMRDQPRG